MSRDLDCLTCGACCISDPPRGFRVVIREDEVSRFPAPWILRVGRFPAIGTVIDAEGRAVCIGLEGAIGSSVGCSVHATKPAACRNFPIGGPLCLKYRKRLISGGPRG